VSSTGNPYILVDIRDVQDPDHDRRMMTPVSTQTSSKTVCWGGSDGVSLGVWLQWADISSRSTGTLHPNADPLEDCIEESCSPRGVQDIATFPLSWGFDDAPTHLKIPVWLLRGMMMRRACDCSRAIETDRRDAARGEPREVYTVGTCFSTLTY